MKYLIFIITFGICSLITVWAVNSMHPEITVHVENRWPFQVRVN